MTERATRFALVIGNGAYSRAMLLTSPALDANTIASTLTELKFDVTKKLDLGYDAMHAAVDEFVQKLKARPAGGSLFYFSGHGVQLQDQNFAVPVDFDELAADKLVKLVRLQT